MNQTQETDICVVGSGASGSVIAAELAGAGYAVIILEAGGETRPDRIPTIRPDWELKPRGFLPNNRKHNRISYTPECDPHFKVSRYKGVGGSTMHYEGFYTRFHEDDFRRGSQTGMGVDWPITYSDLAPFYDRVELRLGVSGTLDNPFDPPRPAYPTPEIAMSCAVKRMKSGCDQLGLHAVHAPMAIISRTYEGRNPCNFCGGCWFGCFQGAISNAAQTYIPRALKYGAELRLNSAVTRILADTTGRQVDGVEYLDADENLHRIKARRVVLCGNSIETARLLLMSSRFDHASGLANSSGLVGKNFSVHSHATVSSAFDEPVNAHKGPNINGMVQDFWDHNSNRDFAGGYLIALRNAQLGPVHHYRRHVRSQKLFGTALMDTMSATFGHHASMSAYGEHFATPDDRIELDAERKDGLGLPVPLVTVNHRANEHAMRAHMIKTLEAIFEAAGGKQITVNDTHRILGTHLLGTCRMGHDATTSVVNAAGRTHDLDNLYIADGSIFPTSTPGNPTLTIQALATRIAHLIAEGDGRSIGI